MFLEAFATCYIASSLLLLKFPHWLHGRKEIKFRAVHISHRGGAGENIENTLTAFQHAVEVGTNLLELDCHLTRDGEVVVTHDSSLKRLCDAEGYVHDYDYKDLPQLSPVHKLDFYQTFVYDGEESADKRIPLLRDIFEAFPDTPINVDIKVNNDELIQKVNQLIKEFKREKITVWGNLSGLFIIADKLYKINPDIPMYFSWSKIVTTVLLFYTGLLPFVPIKESFLEVIMPSIACDDSKFPVRLNVFAKAAFRFLDVLMMRPALFEHLKRRGIQVLLWVLNDDDDFKRAFELGATGAITDFPTRLRTFLDKNPRYLRDTEL